ncbi:MAG: carboxypeptidase regulatory-like domain-containing protein [Pyrinomonas methylaliphatogenes]|nr:carboxypeptidase regulatory-like domain-containing protein [Pyrinomonas methylaliphatogenes]
MLSPARKMRSLWRLFTTSRRLFCAIALLLAFASSPPHATSQVRTVGSINGTVTDQSGAVVAGAKVQLRDELTGATKETVTDEAGNFTFQNLQAGTYEVDVAATGFQPAVYKGVVVESARTTDLFVRLQVGAIAGTVEVVGVAPALEATSNVISNTVRNESIRNLPLGGRNILNFALLVPGSQTVGGNGRNSTYNGMPGGAINITVDGINNNSQGFRSGGTSFFATVPPRLGAIEEVSVQTASLGADAGAQGAMQIRFVTRRGTNEFHGSLFHQLRNDALNANSSINKARGLPRPRLRYNEFGGNLGGPLWRNKLFFFVNYEQARIPSQTVINNVVLTPEAQQGIFRYRGTDGVTRTANLLQIAANNGYPSDIDPIVADYFRRTNATLSNGSVTSIDLFRNNLSFLERTTTIEHYPTARIDYHITPNIVWTGTWNLYNRKISGTRPWPGNDFKEQGAFKNTWYIASTALNWTISPNTLNEFRYGLQHNVDQYNVGEGPDQFNILGRQIRVAYPFIPPIIRDQLNISRANATHNLYDNLTLIRGDHTLTFGGALKYVWWYDADYQGGAGIPTLTVGVAAGDPITTVFSSANLPNISGTDASNAAALYALLTGRVASISTVRVIDPQTKQYQPTQLVRLDKQSTWGLYFQDSWRYRPNLTLNYGLRWEFTNDIYDSRGIYTSPTVEHLFGPSRSLFRPGVLDGVMNPQIFLRPHAYKADHVNPAPNFGIAWSPSFSRGFLAKLFGQGQKTVIRAGYSLTYYDEGLLDFINYAGANPGLIQQLSLNPGQPGFPLGGLRLSDPIPPLTTFPTSFANSFPQADYTFTRGFSTMLPKLRTPYIQTWNIGIQREVAKNTVIEARYVGNKGTHIWHGYSINEVNIFENGFLQEFLNAQRNLAINQAAGVTSFANRGLPGQVPLPIFEAAFGARGSQPALPASSGFANGAFITALRQGEAGRLAAALAGSPIYLCRMVGSNLAPCATRFGFNAPGPYPINFFQVNPFAAGQRLRLMTDESYSSYNGLQIQFRRMMTSGLSITANYTYSKSLTDLYADSPTSEADYITLRNRNLNKGPSPFDLRHVFQVYWSWDLPFGSGRAFAINNPVLDKVLGGWTLSGIVRWQSGRVFKLTSGRLTVNGMDSGVILNGMTTDQLQRLVSIRPGPNGAVYFLDPSLIDAATGRANQQVLTYPTQPGQFGQFIYLYGPPVFIPDLSLSKEIPLTERVKLDFWITALNAFNHPNWEVGGVAGTVSIDSTTFGQTTSQVGGGGPRNVQFRLGLRF